MKSSINIGENKSMRQRISSVAAYRQLAARYSGARMAYHQRNQRSVAAAS